MESRVHLLAGLQGFALDSLRQSLAGDARVIRHPHKTDEVYLIADHPANAARIKAGLEQSAGGQTVGTVWVTVYPRSINVYLDLGSRGALDVAALHLLPLLREQQPQIVNIEFGNDVTEQYRDNPEDLFR